MRRGLLTDDQFRTGSGHRVAHFVYFRAADEELRERVRALANEHYRRLGRVLEDR